MSSKKKCSLDPNTTMDWIIPPDILDNEDPKKSIFKSLFDNVEYAGAFQTHVEKTCNDKNVCKHKHKSVLKELNRGSASSVSTADGYCNFHTHPFSCYEGEKTIWGWPSGEDMRETIGFMLRNNLYHLVFTMEGIYVIQVNPNFLKPFLEINDDSTRGTLVSCIESYFKATHGHRGSEYNKQFRVAPDLNKDDLTSARYGICMPQDWINFANNFTLDNFISSKKNKCSRHLPCNGVPDYDNKTTTTMSGIEYIEQNGFEHYNMSKDGKITNSKKKKINPEQIIDNLESLNTTFKNIDNIIKYGNEEWKQGQWFKCEIFYNEFKCNGMEYINFKDWMNTCISYNNHDITEVIYKFWKSCKTNHDNIRFSLLNPITIKFKAFNVPEGSTVCEMSKGVHIHEWIDSHHHDSVKKKTTKKNKKV